MGYQHNGQEQDTTTLVKGCCYWIKYGVRVDRFIEWSFLYGIYLSLLTIIHCANWNAPSNLSRCTVTWMDTGLFSLDLMMKSCNRKQIHQYNTMHLPVTRIVKWSQCRYNAWKRKRKINSISHKHTHSFCLFFTKYLLRFYKFGS